MAKKLVFSEKFRRDYKKLPKEIQGKFDKQIFLFEKNPSHPSLKIHPLEGTSKTWEGYVDIHYRFTFEIHEHHYFFRRVGTHDILRKEGK